MISGLAREASLAVLLLTLMATPAAAQQTIAGRLISEHSHVPIGNAHLSLLDDSGHVVTRTVSDSTRGDFFLDAPKAGRYSVSILVGRGGLSLSPLFQLDSGQVIERTFAVPEFSQSVLDAYLPDDVTKQAAVAPGGPAVRYPDDMRRKGIQAVVRVTFVVGADGRADMKTFRVLGTVDPSFEDAVRTMVSRTRYIPAERNGTLVSQVYNQVVKFECTEDGRPTGVPEKNEITVSTSGCRR